MLQEMEKWLMFCVKMEVSERCVIAACSCTYYIDTYELGGIYDVNAERAVLDLCNTKLGIAIGPDCIDRTHRLGAPDSSAHNEGARPQPIIVKFTSYRARQDVFMAKRRLKGTKVVITENLTKRRFELLNRAKGLRNVNAAWTSDGRIICLLGNGRKISINSEQDLRNIGRYE